MHNQEKLSILNEIVRILEVDPSTASAARRIASLESENQNLAAFLHRLVTDDDLGPFCADEVRDEARRLLRVKEGLDLQHG